MTKEQKLLLLFVLIIAGSGAGLYISKQMKQNPTDVSISVINTTSTTQVPQATTTKLAPNTEVRGTVSAAPIKPAPKPAPKPASSGTSNVAPVKDPTPKPAVTQPTPEPVVTNPQVKINTITEKTTYSVPSGKIETINVTLVVDDTGIITDASFSYDPPTDRESVQYLSGFQRSFNKSVLVGQKLSGAKIPRTGGASLTTNAFNKFLVTASTKING